MRFLNKMLLSLVFLAGGAQAVTLDQLAVPSAVPSAYPAKVFCSGAVFNKDDSILGTCTSRTASGSSGRGGHPTYTNRVYVASWGPAGNALDAGTYCGTNVVNVPSVNTWTYAPGYSATSCYEPVVGATQISLYNPILGFNEWFFYLTTSVDGAYALISDGSTTGYVYGF